MDGIDLKILMSLQEDATATVADIAAKVALSATACWKRIHKMETLGILRKRVALVSAPMIGLGLTVHISIQAGDHPAGRLEVFMRAVSAMPDLIEFSRLAGDVDYALKVVTTDISAYDAFYKRLTGIVPLRSVISRFELQKIKSTTALPLDIIGDADAEGVYGVNFLSRRGMPLRPV